MKKTISTIVLMSVAFFAQAQISQYPFEKIKEAMECRMVKATGRVVVKGDKESRNVLRNGPIVQFKIIYGAKSSGYSSDDGLYFIPEDSREWKKNGLVGFINTPIKASNWEEEVNGYPLFGYRFFTSGDDAIGFGLGNTKGMYSVLTECVIDVVASSGKYTTFQTLECDFYDISSGRERLVLSGYNPMKDNYKAGNLMRVFFDNMYEYYR